ncbi:MAG: chemotaxis protein CheW, partial [Gammaproteobacteria bacterium]|nr:chemotaxis protein CheW [Gammaproteobacteria bacterium]
KIRAEFIEGMGKIDDKLMVLLDVNHVLSIDELSKIKSIGDELNASSDHAGTG